MLQARRARCRKVMGVYLLLEILARAEPTAAAFSVDLRVSLPRVSSTWTVTSARGTMMGLSSRSMRRTGRLRGCTKVRQYGAQWCGPIHIIRRPIA